MKNINYLALSFCVTFALTGCIGDNDTERAIFGAAVGCAIGEVLQDGRCIAGAAAGAAAGALADDVGAVE